MKFIYCYPEYQGVDADMLDAGPVGDLARAAESVGFEGFGFTEHPMPGANWLANGGHQTIDPFVGLAFAAAATERLILLTYLAVVPYRNPFMLAKTAAALDRLSNERFVLGVGTGYHKSEFFALGSDFDERNALMDEALEVMPLAWSGEPVTYDGRHFTARNVIMRPAPKRQVPIWIGGNAPITLRRVAERAQGWMPLTGTPELAQTSRTTYIESHEDLQAKIAHVRQMAGGRHIDIAHGYTDRDIHDLGCDVERHRQQLADLEGAGIEWITIEGPGGSPQRALDWIRWFGENFIGPDASE